MSAARERARRLLAEALGVGPSEVPEDARLGDPAAWDSLAHMRLVTALESLRGSPLTAEEVLSIRGFEDVARLVEA